MSTTMIGKPDRSKGAENKVRLHGEFDALIARADEEAANRPRKACETYWRARRLSKRAGLGREAEADFGIGLSMMSLGALKDSTECFLRARAVYQRRGDLVRRGWCEVAMAEIEARSGQDQRARRRLRAADALLASIHGAASGPVGVPSRH